MPELGSEASAFVQIHLKDVLVGMHVEIVALTWHAAGSRASPPGP